MTRDLQQRYRIRNCDSAFQAERWRSLELRLCYPGAGVEDIFAGDGEVCRSFLGQNPQIAEEMNRVIRASLLYEDELVIDAHDLLDGIFFMALGPDYFHSLIDDRRFSSFRLVVESRKKSLEEALRAFIAPPEPATKEDREKKKRVFSLLSAINPDHDHFCWDELTKEQRDVLEDLRQAKTWEVSEYAQRVLETCLNLRVDSLAFVRHRWDEWFRAVREGVVRVMPLSDCEWQRRTGSFRGGMERIMEAHRKSGVAYICGDPIGSRHRSCAGDMPETGGQSDVAHQSAETFISHLEETESRSDGFAWIKEKKDKNPNLDMLNATGKEVWACVIR